MYNIFQIIIRRCRRLLNLWAKKQLMNNVGLWEVLSEYTKNVHFSGKHYYKYLFLYKKIRTIKPQSILECGTGVSTIVMAHALRENEMDGYSKGNIVSMEEISGDYFDNMNNIIPDELRSYISLIYSPKIEDTFRYFRGVRYESIPDNQYDLIFVDGPTTKNISDDGYSFDMDLLVVLPRLKKSVPVIIDGRKSSCMIYRIVFGKKALLYNNLGNIGFMPAVSNSDMCSRKKIANSSV